jgi:hypothetical protein
MAKVTLESILDIVGNNPGITEDQLLAKFQRGEERGEALNLLGEAIGKVVSLDKVGSYVSREGPIERQRGFDDQGPVIRLVLRTGDETGPVLTNSLIEIAESEGLGTLSQLYSRVEGARLRLRGRIGKPQK